MSSLPVELEAARAMQVKMTGDSLLVDLIDGRSISVPLAWYPRLFHGKSKERNHWRLIGQGEGVHWPDLDEDISVVSLLVGRPSRESQQSLQRWLDARQKSKKGSR